MQPWYLLLWAMLWSAVFPTQATAQTPSPPGDEVIVKFANGSRGQQIYRSAVSGGPRAEAELDTLAAELSDALDIPVRIDRLASGQEFILSVDTAILEKRLLGRLADHPQVSKASPLPGAAGAVVELKANSPLYEALGGDRENTAAGERFAAVIGQPLGIELAVRAPRLLELTIHREALVAALLEKLRQRPDVEYAQANRLLQPFGDTPPGAGVARPMPARPV